MTGDITKNSQREIATLGNGCFWCTEAIFQQLDGAIQVTSGYSGGEISNPSYKTVSTGTTGHAECLQIVYDPFKINFDGLLEVFWHTHDPTTLNRQGSDIGNQYRSVVFYHDETQKSIAERYLAQLQVSETFDRPIVTSLESFSGFYAAEDDHQNYYNVNINAPYCQFVIRPRLEKFVKHFPEKLKS